MTVSIWQRSEGVGGAEPLAERVDLVVIGGGIVGVSAALEAARLRKSVVLLERYGLAAGASGRNAGYLMRGMAETYAVAVDRLGRERARAVWAWSEANIRAVRSLAQGSGAVSDRPSCLLALNETDAADLERSAALLREDGFEGGLISADERSRGDVLVRSGRVLAALVNPGDGVCQPVRVVEALATRLRDAAGDAAVRTGVEVFEIQEEGNSARVLTSAGGVTAERVLICTNGAARELADLPEDAILPRRGQMLAARSGSKVELSYAYYFNRGDEYVRIGDDGLVLMGGARSLEPAEEAGDHGGTNGRVQAALEGWMRDLITGDFEVVRRWSGVMGFTASGLPYVGPCRMRAMRDSGERSASGSVWLCAGFTGHGMSLGHLTGTAAARGVLGVDDRPALFDAPPIV